MCPYQMRSFTDDVASPESFSFANNSTHRLNLGPDSRHSKSNLGLGFSYDTVKFKNVKSVFNTTIAYL